VGCRLQRRKENLEERSMTYAIIPITGTLLPLLH